MPPSTRYMLFCSPLLLKSTGCLYLRYVCLTYVWIRISAIPCILCVLLDHLLYLWFFSLRHFSRCFVVCLFREERLKGRALVWCYLFARIYCGNTTVRRTDTTMLGRRYIDWLDDANVAGLCKTTGLATIKLTHLAYFFLTFFCLVCASSPVFIRIDISCFGRCCLGWSWYSFWPTPPVKNGKLTLRGGPKFTTILFVAIFLANICRSQNVAHREVRESSVNWLFANVLFVPIVN